jgi:hypothetical protein
MYYGRSLSKLGRTCSLISRVEESTLKIELQFSLQISVNTFKTIRGYIPEDAILHSHHGENIDCHRNNLHQILLVGQIGDRLCGLVVRVSGYRSRGPGFDSRPYQIF